MRTVLLIILDGYGIAPAGPYNAVTSAQTPHLDHYFGHYPYTTLRCSGPDVGMPEGVMGNSEVGHITIGAGRIVKQDLVRVDTSIEDGSFFRNSVLNRAMENVRASRTRLHLLGLVSDGRVHSSLEHVIALLRYARQSGVEKVCVHAITDGRDTSPAAGVKYLGELLEATEEIGVGRVSTVIGRYYAMDRDRRWDRTERAYRALTTGEGEKFSDPVEALKCSYAEGVSDEFVRPIVVYEEGRPTGLIGDGDTVIAFNFRADRMRQIVRALTEKDFREFDRPELDLSFVTMTRYGDSFDLPVVFEPVRTKQVLGEVLAAAGMRQIRIAETEKYPHVTYFINAGEEEPFIGEDRVLVPSPKVGTYDLQPSMSAAAVTEEVLAAISAKCYDLIVVNYANPDMLGHTGSLEAAIIAVEAVDAGVGEIIPALLAQDGVALLTADHGNAEVMFDVETNKLHTAHTTNPVPFALVSAWEGSLRGDGGLRDIAPTVFAILGLETPKKMSGKTLMLPVEESVMVDEVVVSHDGD